MSKTRTAPELGIVLDQLYESYLADFKRSPAEFFVKRMDPLAFAHRYSEFHDIEAAAFLAATFAYGKVQSLCSFVNRLLSLLGTSPYAFLRQGPSVVDTLESSRPYYRLHKTAEILDVLRMMARVYRDHGSLFAVFMQSYDIHNTTSFNIGGFVRELYSIHRKQLPFLLPLPESGSPCKRLHLFLRWMVRRDGIDLGLWKEVSPAGLMIPLDTHIGRVAFRLGWIQTPSLSWKKAETITAILRKFNPDDPVRYDFSLCHESIQRSSWLQKVIAGRNQKRSNRSSPRSIRDGEAPGS